MNIQVLNRYKDYATIGLLPALRCPVGEDHLPLQPGINFETDDLFLYCLTCQYQNNIGLNTYDWIARQVANLDG